MRPGAIPFMNPTPGGNTAGGATSLSAKLGGPTHTLLFCADPEICLEALTIRHFADSSSALFGSGGVLTVVIQKLNKLFK